MRIRVLCVLLAVATTIFVVQTFGGNDDGDVPMRSFTELSQQLEFGNVEGLEFTNGSARVTAFLADGDRFEAIVPPTFMDTFVEDLVDNEPDIQLRTLPAPRSIGSALAVWVRTVAPILLMVLLVWLIWARMGSRGNSGFDANKRLLTGDETPTTFADVAGADEAIVELSEIRDFLKDPRRFHELGARIPKGVLLYGPPGTGKTLLARAVAGEAGVPFYTLSGSDFVESFVGVGASRVRKLFEAARENAPAIIFVDEIDAVGRHRGGSAVNGNEEREQTLNQLLVEMDGFEADSGVIFIAATNRPDILDPALLRPGRFDRQVGVDRPDLGGRREIVGVHSRGKLLADDVSVDTIARRTPGFTGADLANLLNEAALLTARRRKTAIGQAELDDALDRVIAGPEKSNTLSDTEQEIIAYHEAGHALVGHVLPGCDPIHKVSVIARGRALGWTLALPERDRVMKTESELQDEMAMLLGGRIAEEIIFADPTTGAANDIERVTAIARNMVSTYGMSKSLGLQKFGTTLGEAYAATVAANYSDEIAATIDNEIRQLIADAGQRARSLLETNRDLLHEFARELLEHETLDEQGLAPILGRAVGPQATRTPAGAIDLR